MHGQTLGSAREKSSTAATHPMLHHFAKKSRCSSTLRTTLSWTWCTSARHLGPYIWSSFPPRETSTAHALPHIHNTRATNPANRTPLACEPQAERAAAASACRAQLPAERLAACTSRAMAASQCSTANCLRLRVAIVGCIQCGTVGSYLQS